MLETIDAWMAARRKPVSLSHMLASSSAWVTTPLGEAGLGEGEPLVYRDTATARRLTELPRLQADLTTSAIAAHFARPPDLAAGADSAG
jgi:hypothetical protein